MLPRGCGLKVFCSRIPGAVDYPQRSQEKETKCATREGTEATPGSADDALCAQCRCACAQQLCFFLFSETFFPKQLAVRGPQFFLKRCPPLSYWRCLALWVSPFICLPLFVNCLGSFGGGISLIALISKLKTSQFLYSFPEMFGSEWLQEQECCSICLEQLHDDGMADVVKLPCGHHFHKSCTAKWFASGKLCTVCFSSKMVWYSVP